MPTENSWVGHGRSSATVASAGNSSIAERLVLMCASALFNGLTTRECSEIASCGRARTFAQDELLFSQGQPVNRVILLESGSVKHTQIGANGSEVLVRISGSGEAVDVQGGRQECGHTCSARAMEQCRALVWDYARLQALLDRYPQISQNINQILAGRLRELEERFREVATERVAKRLALVLLRLVKQVGKKSADGVAISLNREELSQMTGTTLFTISRVLSKWADEGFVVPRREAVIVSDPKRLEAAGNEED